MSNVINFRTRKPHDQAYQEFGDMLINALSKPKVTSWDKLIAIEKQRESHQYQSLPAWVIADLELNRQCHDLMAQGWKYVAAVNLEHVRTVFFEHPQVTTVPKRLIGHVEAMQIQASFWGGKRVYDLTEQK